MKSKLLISFLSIGIFLLFRSSYVEFLGVQFSYMGFKLSHSLERTITVFVIFTITLLFITNIKRDFKYAVVMVFFLLGVIPSLVLYEFYGGRFDIVAFNLLLIFATYKVAKFNNKELPPVPIYELRSKLRIIAVIVVVLLVPYALNYGTNVRFDVLNILSDAVYEQREVSRSSGTAITSYIYSWMTMILLPIGAVYSIYFKKKTLLIFFVLVLLYLYLVNPQKSRFLGFAFIIFLYFGKTYEIKIIRLFAAVFILALVSRIFTEYYDFIFLESMVSRRTFFVPALLNEAYFEVFSDEKLYLSYSKFNPFLEYKYNEMPPAIVAEKFLNIDGINANNGMISVGYMNFGYIGVIGNILLVALLVRYLSKANLDVVFFGIVFVIIRTIFSTALFTTLVTHGVLILLLLIRSGFLRDADLRKKLSQK